MMFNNDFIGSDYPNTTQVRNTISYTYNSLGHRCKDIDKVNLDNYILFIGCSNTEGVGLSIENTYPYLTSLNLNCDYYNLGVGGSGMDILFYNLFTWLHKFKKPRAIVIQYPDPSRFSTMVSNTNNIVPRGSWNKDEDIARLYVSANDQGLLHLRNVCCNKLIDNVIDVPIIKLIFGNIKISDYDGTDYIKISKLDHAVDMIHSGIKTQQYCSKMIVDKYINATVHTATRG